MLSNTVDKNSEKFLAMRIFTQKHTFTAWYYLQEFVKKEQVVLAHFFVREVFPMVDFL